MTAAAMKDIAVKDESILDARERLSFTIFMAIALHLLIIIGVRFSLADKSKISPTINITVATYQSNEAPDAPDYLAQFNQKGSGTLETKREITTREIADMSSPDIHQVSPVPQQKSVLESRKSEQFVTSSRGTQHVTRVNEDDALDNRQRIDAQDEDTPQLDPEIASLRAKLDKLQQEFAGRPRIRRMTSVSTKASADAAYLNHWTQKIEATGNRNFPKAAIDNKIYGALRLSVLINSDGSVASVELLKPSGHPVLDNAAIQTVHMAAPYDPFPAEIAEEADQLDIIRTWRFEITGMSTGE